MCPLRFRQYPTLRTPVRGDKQNIVSDRRNLETTPTSTRSYRPRSHGRTLQSIRLTSPKGLENSFRPQSIRLSNLIDCVVYILQGCGPKAGLRPRAFRSSLPEGITRLLINFTHLPATPLPQPYTEQSPINDTFMAVVRYIAESDEASLRDPSLPPPALKAIRQDVSRALKLPQRVPCFR